MTIKEAMTREEARQIIASWLASSKGEKGQCGYIEGWFGEEDVEAFKMAIEALEKIESGRYIKGECSICSKEFGTLGCCTTVSNHWVYSCKEGMAQYAEALEKEPKCGKWIVYPLMDEGRVELKCPICGDTFIRAVYHKPHFCENCGADMRGDEE